VKSPELHILFAGILVSYSVIDCKSGTGSFKFAAFGGKLLKNPGYIILYILFQAGNCSFALMLRNARGMWRTDDIYLVYPLKCMTYY